MRAASWVEVSPLRMLKTRAARRFAVQRWTVSENYSDTSATSWSHSTMYWGWLQSGGEQDTRPYGAGIAPVENGTPGLVDFRILSGKTL